MDETERALAYNEGWASGETVGRKAIVKWLRSGGPWGHVPGGSIQLGLDEVADAIENGEHLK